MQEKSEGTLYPVNILRIVYDFPPPWWGLAPGPYELTKAQVKLGHKIKVYCGEWPKKRSYREEKMQVVRLPRTLPGIGPFFTYGPTVLSKYLLEKERFDLIHAHNFHPIYYYLWRKYFGKKIPLIIHMHITVAARTEKFKNSSNFSFLTKNVEWKLAEYFERLGCQLADAIICVSEYVKEEVLRYYKPDPQKVFVVNNGVNTRLFNHNVSSKRDELGLDNNKVITYVGVLNQRKNVGLLIRSLSLLSNEYVLLIIGTGPAEMGLKQLAGHLGVSSRVKFAGYIPYPELPSYYRSSDVFCLTSSFEGLPKVVLEALACGIPVISSQSFSVNEDLSRNIVWLKNNSPEEIASKIREIIESSKGVNVREIEKKFDWTVTARKLQKIYENIV